MGEKNFTAEDYVEIQQLYAHYGHTVDLGDGDARIATFTPDGLFSSRMTDRQPENMESVRDRTNKKGNDGSRHLQYNISIVPTAEGADGIAYVLVLHQSEGFLTKGGMGVYHDKLVKTPEGWRFKSREMWNDYEPSSPFNLNL